MNEYKIILPLKDEEVLEKIKVGDKVYISGEIFVFRDQVHKKIFMGEIGNFDLSKFHNSGIYYCASTPPKEGFVIGSCGPTSSYRMDPYTEVMLRLGIKIMIGKGIRDKTIAQLCSQYKALYLVTYGGCGALLNKYVKQVELVAYPELKTEAMYKYYISNFPTIVAIDTKGNTIY